MNMTYNRTDIARHEMTLNEIRDILDRHKPDSIKCWRGQTHAYLTIGFEIGFNITLFTQSRPIEEVDRLIADTKNKSRTRMIYESEHADNKFSITDTEPYNPEEE
tara:strand:+ start:724 stop:1038 length:315 start_codon:yes stop_codon:yes gene_type:complete